MIPLRDDNPSQTAPVVTRTLIVVNTLAFLYELSLGRGLAPFVYAWGLVPARLTASLAGAVPLPPAAATALTSMFLHGGWIHLLGNMWYLWLFGDNVEDRLGHGRYLLFYLASGLVSAAAQVYVNPGSPVPTVGASGAIAGVLGAYALAFPRARVLTLVPVFFFFQVLSLPALVVLGLWFVVQFFSGALAIGAGVSGGIAWWAHIAGFVFGFAAMALLGGRRPRSRAWVARG